MATRATKYYRGATKTSDSSLNGMVAQAMKASEKTWQPAQAAFLHQFDDETALKSQVDTVSRLNIQASAANRVTFTGSSSHPGLFPGAVINVKTIAPEDHREFGRYVITSINHRFRDGGNYQNQFEAVPFDVEVSPLTNTTAFPICSPQPGKVTNNNDPEGLGRVKVQLQWQRNSTTPWLRISTPYAGSDKGMFFVPEIGEEVVVGFENSNAEKPYVMGSLYHGKARPESFVTKKNDIKAIRTRTGHTIEFNDTDGDEKIIITDKNQNFIKINTNTNDIHISSGNDLKLSAKNIQFDATENIYVGAGKNMNCSIGETFNVMAKDVNEHVENEVISSSKKSETNSEEVTINSTSKNLTLASNKSVDIQSNEKVKLF